MTSTATQLMARCDELAAITALPGRIDRFHLTQEHRRANELVGGWMREAGMHTWTDAAGNICGRLDPGLHAYTVLLGSHLDTVPDAGAYDGPLGVVLAIEVVRRLCRESLPAALEVIGFGDEEGVRFGTALFGSKAVAGAWDPSTLAATDAEGITLAQALTDFGLDPDRVGDAARDDLRCYLEAHIEQGPELEAAGLGLGTVTSMAGARRFAVVLHGEARHAGGTPYERRKDALLGASRLVVEVDRLARERGVIATVGRLQAFPGAVNVIPGRVELSLDLRAETDTNRDGVADEIARFLDGLCAETGLRAEVTQTHSARSVPCALPLQDAITAAIRATGQQVVPRMWSRAGHDAMALAGVTDVGMLFLRCHDGISHHREESVLAEDVAAAADAFEAAVRHVCGALG
jgi:allantoate deiminase